MYNDKTTRRQRMGLQSVNQIILDCIGFAALLGLFTIVIIILKTY